MYWWYCIQAYNVAYPLYLFPERNMLDFQSRSETSTADRARAFPTVIHLKIKTKIITEARDLINTSGDIAFHYPAAMIMARNAKEKNRRDFSIDGDLRRPFASSSLLITIPCRFSRSVPLSVPSPPNIPDIIWTATVDHLSPSFSLFLVRLLRNSLSAKGEGWREEEGRDGRRRWKTSDVCPRGIVIFIGSQLSRGFSFSCPVAPCRRLPPIAARKAGGNENTLLFIRRKAHAGRSSGCFDCSICSVDRIARDDRGSNWIITRRPFVEN